MGVVYSPSAYRMQLRDNPVIPCLNTISISWICFNEHVWNIYIYNAIHIMYLSIYIYIYADPSVYLLCVYKCILYYEGLMNEFMIDFYWSWIFINFVFIRIYHAACSIISNDPHWVGLQLFAWINIISFIWMKNICGVKRGQQKVHPREIDGLWIISKAADGFTDDYVMKEQPEESHFSQGFNTQHNFNLAGALTEFNFYYSHSNENEIRKTFTNHE